MFQEVTAGLLEHDVAGNVHHSAVNGDLGGGFWQLLMDFLDGVSVLPMLGLYSEGRGTDLEGHETAVALP